MKTLNASFKATANDGGLRTGICTAMFIGATVLSSTVMSLGGDTIQAGGAKDAIFKSAFPQTDTVQVDDTRMILDPQTLTIQKNISARSANDTLQLEFEAFDKTFSLNLLPNAKLINSMSVDTHSNVKIYKGAVGGAENSWARLSVRDGLYSGAIYDGEALYLIDEYSTVSDDIAPWKRAQMATEKPVSVIYRYADIVNSASCGLENDDISTYDQLIDDIRVAATAGDLLAVAESQININIVADTEYVASSNGDVDAQVLSQMNIVNGIFSDQVGVQLGIESIIPLSDNGPLTSTSSSTLLRDFRDFVNDQIINPGLVHLFSGKDLDGSTVGRAFVGVLCDTSGVGITTLGGRGSLGAIFAAHEFGHNFGAPHDNQSGSVCASTPNGFLMNPSISSSNNSFSDCSLQQIAPNVANASCLVPVVGATPTPAPTPVPTSTPAPVACIDLENTTRFSTPNTGSIDVDGCTMALSGNEWRASEATFSITPSSRLQFDFSANGTGEIHGIGFDEDTSASNDRIFRLTGSQNWGISNFSYTGGTQSFDIPLGQFYTGPSMRLILVNDKDNGVADNQSSFSNIRLVN